MGKDITNILEREYSITLHHDYTAERGHSFSYETGETINMFAAGTIGAINGGNIKTAPLPDSLDELVEIVRILKKEKRLTP